MADILRTIGSGLDCENPEEWANDLASDNSGDQIGTMMDNAEYIGDVDIIVSNDAAGTNIIKLTVDPAARRSDTDPVAYGYGARMTGSSSSGTANGLLRITSKDVVIEWISILALTAGASANTAAVSNYNLTGGTFYNVYAEMRIDDALTAVASVYSTTGPCNFWRCVGAMSDDGIVDMSALTNAYIFHNFSGTSTFLNCTGAMVTAGGGSTSFGIFRGNLGTPICKNCVAIDFNNSKPGFSGSFDASSDYNFTNTGSGTAPGSHSFTEALDADETVVSVNPLSFDLTWISYDVATVYRGTNETATIGTTDFKSQTVLEYQIGAYEFLDLPEPQTIVVRRDDPATGTIIPYDGTINFGSVVVGDTGTSINIYITNTGDDDLTLGSPTKLSITGTDPTDWTKDETDYVETVPGHSSTVFSLAFSPADVGARDAYVRFSQNDGDVTTPFKINLTGTGSAAPTPGTGGPRKSVRYGRRRWYFG